jgi:2-oxoglutarate dehydrogenase E2 component (dihydrolipoamide succinyltransferase)
VSGGAHQGKGDAKPGELAVLMPKLSDTLVEGTVARWLKAAGDRVAKGDPIADIETDKVASELVAPADGILAALVAPEGEPVPVESVIAWIRVAETAAPRESAEPASLLPEQRESLAPEPPAAEPAPELRGHALPSPAAMRRSIAAHMVKAWSTIPHGQTVMDADMTSVAAFYDEEKAASATREGVKLTYTALFVAALARAVARSGPELGITVPDRGVDIGVAVAAPAGLLVPVVRGAARLSLVEIARSIADLAARARQGKLALTEMEGALLTVTNVGTFGNLTAFPIIPLHQIAILGPGLVEPRPLASADGGVRLGVRCLLALVFDRRALSDLAADRLLREVIDELGRAAAARG